MKNLIPSRFILFINNIHDELNHGSIQSISFSYLLYDKPFDEVTEYTEVSRSMCWNKHIYGIENKKTSLRDENSTAMRLSF